jgi:hypothetical protein
MDYVGGWDSCQVELNIKNCGRNYLTMAIATESLVKSTPLVPPSKNNLNNIALRYNTGNASAEAAYPFTAVKTMDSKISFAFELHAVILQYQKEN